MELAELRERQKWTLQQRLSKTVEDAVQALRLSTNLIYDLNAKIKNVNYRHADFLTHRSRENVPANGNDGRI